MSVQEGKKIVSALEAFNANKIIGTDVTSLLTVALRSGGVTSRHIEKLHQALEKEVDSLPAGFGVLRPPLKGKNAFISYGHMTVNSDADGTMLYDQYTPNLVSYSITPHKYIRDQVLLPLSFNSQHTAFSFIRHTSKVLDYKSSDFFIALMFGNTMMQALSSSPDGLPSRPIPMFLPHAEGLFTGFAERMPDDTYKRRVESSTRKGKRVVSTSEVAGGSTQPYLPRVRTVVKTFISKDDMSLNKFLLWKYLHDLMDNPKYQDGRSLSLSCHIVDSTARTQQQTDALQELFGEIHRVMNTDEWNFLSDRAIQNQRIPVAGHMERIEWALQKAAANQSRKLAQG